MIPGISDTRDRKLWSGLGMWWCRRRHNGRGNSGKLWRGDDLGFVRSLWWRRDSVRAGTGGVGRGGGGCCATGWVGDGGGPCSGDAASVLCAEAVVSLEIE